MKRKKWLVIALLIIVALLIPLGLYAQSREIPPPLPERPKKAVHLSGKPLTPTALARLERNVQTQDNSDEALIIKNYLGGKVIKLGKENVVIKSYSGDKTLYISADTEIWKGEWNKMISSIEIGDRIEAWGDRKSDDELVVEKMWVNIVNTTGVISNIVREASKLTFTLEDDRTRKTYVIEANEKTKFHHEDGDKSFDDKGVVKEGEYIQVIGLDIGENEVQATRIFL